LGPPCGFEGSKRSKKGELRCEKWGSDHTFAVPSQKKRVLEVIRRRLEGVVGGEFIKSFSGVDELWYWRRSLKVRNALRLHDVLDGMRVLFTERCRAGDAQQKAKALQLCALA
jgi:hypothetical protein